MTKAPEPERDTLQFSTNIQVADVYLLFDITTSMDDELNAMRTATSELVAALSCEDFGTPCGRADDCGAGQVCGAEQRCLEDPSTSQCVASLWTGLGTYEGRANTYRNRLGLQPDAALTQATIPLMADGVGADEALFQSVACVADPSVCTATCSANASRIGCPAFRSEAVRILVAITDEEDQCSTCNVRQADDAGERLLDAGIRFVGVNAASDARPRNQLRDLGTAAMSFDRAGAPLVFDGDGNAVSDAVANANRRDRQGRASAGDD